MVTGYFQEKNKKKRKRLSIRIIEGNGEDRC